MFLNHLSTGCVAAFRCTSSIAVVNIACCFPTPSLSLSHSSRLSRSWHQTFMGPTSQSGARWSLKSSGRLKFFAQSEKSVTTVAEILIPCRLVPTEKREASTYLPFCFSIPLLSFFCFAIFVQDASFLTNFLAATNTSNLPRRVVIFRHMGCEVSGAIIRREGKEKTGRKWRARNDGKVQLSIQRTEVRDICRSR